MSLPPSGESLPPPMPRTIMDDHEIQSLLNRMFDESTKNRFVLQIANDFFRYGIGVNDKQLKIAIIDRLVYNLNDEDYMISMARLITEINDKYASIAGDSAPEPFKIKYSNRRSLRQGGRTRRRRRSSKSRKSRKSRSTRRK